MKLAFSLFVLLAALGCSARDAKNPIERGTDAGPLVQVDGGETADAPTPAACFGTITGRVTLPDGIRSAPAALIYEPATAEPLRTGECQQCLEGSDLLAHTTTAVDGTFSMQLPLGSHTLFVEKALFKRGLAVTVRECGETIALPAGATRLPRDRTEGYVPRIALVTGWWDHMETVLAALGMAPDEMTATETFVPYSGDGYSAFPADTELFINSALLNSYDMVVVNCGNQNISTLFATDEARVNIRAFVSGGGRLFVTDESSAFIEETFPEAIDFVGSEGDGLGEEPEAQRASFLGEDGLSVRADILDAAAAQWMAQYFPSSDATVPIDSFVGGWAVMDRVDTSRTKTWVASDVSWYSDEKSFESTSGYKPLTVSFDHGCGRVVYSSYHTAEESSGSALAAQELMLGYLLVEIASCVSEPMIW